MERKKIFVIASLVILVAITLATSYYGSTDVGDYADVAKYFAGEYKADIRSSHSYFHGFIHAPFVGLTNNFIFFKISSLIFLIAIIYSVYIISGRNNSALFLILVSPVIWYMGPWINPIQLASLCLLWAWHFMKKYDCSLKFKHLALSAFFTGFGLVFWDTILFFGGFLALAFLFNKKLSHSVYFIIFLLIGFFPRLIFDSLIFNFPFYTLLRNLAGAMVNILGGIYDKQYGHTPLTFFSIILILLSIPQYFWLSYKNKHEKKSLIFLTLCLFLILMNTQIRYFLAIVPIITVLISKNLNKNQRRNQIIISATISLIFISPYFIQIPYGIDSFNYPEGMDIVALMRNQNANLINQPYKNFLSSDLEKLSNEFPNESFLIVGSPDSYATLARYYWGKEIKEFVSIQDYNAWLNNETSLFKKEWRPVPNIEERRQIWLAGGMSVNKNDNTDYSSLRYAITIGEEQPEGFSLIRNYQKISVWEKNYRQQ